MSGIAAGSTPSLRLLRFALGIVIISLSQATSSLGAEPSQAELMRARDAYRRGLVLEAAQDWGGAMARFRQVAAVKATAQVHFHIARCQEKLGNWTEALGGYRMALAEPTGRDEVGKTAEQALESLEAKIPRVVIKRGAGAETASISLDGTTVAPDLIGAPIPVNPGGHTIGISVPGGKSRNITVVLGEGQRTSIDASPDEPPTTPPQPPQPAAEPISKTRLLSWVLIGTGGASLVTSGVFYGLRANALSDLDSTCKNDRCPQSSQDTYDSAKSYNTIANITLGAGIGLAATGAVLWYVSRPAPKPSPAANAASLPFGAIAIVPGGLVYSGRF
jgi:hypothetical protein